MAKLRLIGFSLIFLFACVMVSYATPVEVPLDLKANNSSDMINLIIEYDSLLERGINIASGSVENADILSIKAYGNFSIYNGTGSVYSWIGNASGMEYKASIAGSDVRFNLKDSLMWGVGLNFELSKDNETFLRHFVDVNYRALAGADYDSVEVGGSTSSGTNLEPILQPKYTEVQAAFGVCKKIYNFLPYAGVTISAVHARAAATVSGTLYKMSVGSDDKKFGAFWGCKLIMLEELSLDAQFRVGAEEGITLKGTYSF